MNLKNIIADVAPTIGTALGGPLAGLAINQLLKLFNLSPTANEKDIEKAILAGPEALLKLKEFDMQFKQHLLDVGIDLERVDAADRDSARKREEELAKAGRKDYTTTILASCTVCGWLIIQFYLFTHVIPTEMREIIMRSLGTLDAALGMVFTYYFGSSKSSAQKDEIIKSKLLS